MDADQQYRRVNGVAMKPGTHVFCDDRDEPVYDMAGTITAVVGEHYYDVQFGTASRRMHEHSISPTSEEQQSSEACQWRAERSLRVFLCHATEDKKIVRALHARLKDLGFRPWLDEVDLLPGVEWEQAIQEAVHNSHVIIACISPASCSKIGFVQKEIRYALDRAMEMPDGAIYIIPVRLSECILPKALRKWQAVDLFAERGESRLVEALRVKAKAIALLPGA